MERDPWDRIGKLFEDASQLHGADRDAFLATLTEDSVAAEVRSLLAAHEARGRFDELSDVVAGPEVLRLFRVQPGDQIGPYRVVHEIGSGGMATVYLGHDAKHGRRVAIKVLRVELAATLGVERFLREIEIASRLTHPHIVPLFDSGEANGLLYYVMPYIEGESLRDRLARDTRLSVDETISLTEQVCSALNYAHERGIVHRDIKPENILLTGDRAVVADFGIARAIAAAGDDQLTRPGLSIGTPAYMSPEQIERGGEVDARTDVYSLGCVVYETIGGRRPFDARTPHTQRVRTPAPALRTTDPAVPVFVERAVQRALATHPDDRFQTPTQFAAALTTGTVVARLGQRQRRQWIRRSGAAAASIAIGWLLVHLIGTARIDRIAVLPLVNLSDAEDYLVEGVHEALISELAQLGVPVIARASMTGYANSTLSLREIARELEVDRIIEGSIYRTGDSLEISARLYNAEREQEVWNGTYDGDLPNVIRLYRAFARAIAGEIDVALDGDVVERHERTASLNPRVYEAYLRGMHLLNQSTAESFAQALDYFDEAVALDPADPRAYAGLAFAYITLAHGPSPPPDALYLARAAAERAVRLDSTLAEGWAALADIRTYLLWEWDGADDAFDRANALNPSMAMNHYHRAWYLLLRGRNDEAIAEHELARRLDPLTPLHTVWLPGVYLLAGRREEALVRARDVVTRYPDNATALYVLGLAALARGEPDEALAAHEKATAINPIWSFALGRTYALTGRVDEARTILAQLEAQPRTSFGAYTLAALHTALGNRDEAFRWLAYEPPHAWLPWVGLMLEFEPLREDPRFAEVRQRLRFPDAHEQGLH